MDGCPLTPRQLEILEGLAEGLGYKEIAMRQGVAYSTVRTQLHDTYRRLGVADRAQAVLRCVQQGWITIEGVGASEDGQLARVRREIRALAEALRARDANTTDGYAKPLTFRQREYLAAFDAHLRASEIERPATRARMTEALGPMLAEAGVGDAPRKRPDLVDLLVRMAA